MTDARIVREFPDLSKPLALVATLGEALAMASDMKLTHDNINRAGSDNSEAEKLYACTGLREEIIDAEKTISKTIVEILVQVSEKDLADGCDLELLSPEDYREAVKAKRTMELDHGRSHEQEHDLER